MAHYFSRFRMLNIAVLLSLAAAVYLQLKMKDLNMFTLFVTSFLYFSVLADPIYHYKEGYLDGILAQQDEAHRSISAVRAQAMREIGIIRDSVHFTRLPRIDAAIAALESLGSPPGVEDNDEPLQKLREPDVKNITRPHPPRSRTGIL